MHCSKSILTTVLCQGILARLTCGSSFGNSSLPSDAFSSKFMCTFVLCHSCPASTHVSLEQHKTTIYVICHVPKLSKGRETNKCYAMLCYVMACLP